MKQRAHKKRATLPNVAVFFVLILAGCSEAPKSNVYEARRHTENYQISPVIFRSMDSFFPTAVVDAPTPGPTLPSAPMSMTFDVTLSGTTYSFEDALTYTDTNALLVIKDGNIVFETYRNGAGSKSRFISWSMSKSIVSMLVGAALRDGYIKDIDDPIDLYVSSLKGTAFEGVTIRHLLLMRGGTNYREYKPVGTADVDVLAEASLYTNQTRFINVSQIDLERVNEPGEKFNYSTLTSTILGRAVEIATDRSLAAYTQEMIWEPAGMQQSGYWLLDGPAGEGLAFGGGGYNATLRDYGRIGLMMLQGGEINGRQVLPKDWVEISTRHHGDEPVFPKAPRGYGYQWWTFMGSPVFEAIGIHGQFISVDPTTNTVIVKLSYWPDRGGGAYAPENHQLLTAIRQHVSKN